MSSIGEESKNIVERTLSSHADLVGIYEPVVPYSYDPIDPSNREMTCPICLEDCSEELPMWQMGHCSHEICKICYLRLLESQTFGPQTMDPVKCPFCRKNLDSRIRWSLPGPSKILRVQNFLSDHYDHPLGSADENRSLIGLDQDGNLICVVHTATIEVRQVGDFTELLWSRKMAIRKTSCSSCINAHRTNCTTTEAVSQYLNISEFLDLAASRYAAWKAIRQSDRVMYSAIPESTTGDNPLFVETLLQESMWRRFGDNHDHECLPQWLSECLPCSSPSGSSSFRVTIWSTKIRERVYPHSLILLKWLPSGSEASWRRLFKAFVELQMLLAITCPEVQLAAELAPFLESQGLRLSHTSFTLSPQDLFPHVVEQAARDGAAGIMGSFEFIRRRLRLPGSRLDERDRPLIYLAEPISPWYKELQDLHGSIFSC